MPEKPTQHYDVLVLGGGFAGVYCAKELAKRARKDSDFKAGIVAAENYMVFQPMLPEVAAASISPRHVINPIRQMCRGIQVFKGEVVSIDTEAKIIHVSAGDFTPDVALTFDQLVVALGATVDLSRVPGMPEHALLMQNVGDAMKLRSVTISRLEEANLVADPEIKERLLRIVVVGGGYSGVETAGELLDLLSEIHSYYAGIAEEECQVVLVHSGDTLLPTLSRDLGEYVLRKLEARGMTIILNRRVQSVTATTVTLNDGTVINAATVVSTIGNSPHPRILELSRARGLDCFKGRLRTEPNGRVKGLDWLWAAGDCSAFGLPDGGTEICPPTAQFAQRQGTLVGKNILRLRDSQPAEPFKFKGLGELAAIGHRNAVANIMGFKLQGFLAWWMWRSIYLMKLPGLQRKIRVLVDWTLDLFFARDINLLDPNYTRLLKAVYLEPGDTLFKPGEPAFSLYFVKEGEIEIRDGDYLIKRVPQGDYFGERALLDDGVWHYRAVATKATCLIGLGKGEFLAIVKGSDALRKLFERSAQAYLSQEETKALRTTVGEHTLNATAGALMNTGIDVLHPGMHVTEAVNILKERRHGSYPLVDDAGLLRGVIKRDDIFDYLKSHTNCDTDTLEKLPTSVLPTINKDATGSDIIDIFLRSGRNKILVIDSDEKLLGIITLLDLVTVKQEC